MAVQATICVESERSQLSVEAKPFPSGVIGSPFVPLVLKRTCNLQFLNGTGTSMTLAQEGVTPVLPRVRLAPAKRSQLDPRMLLR